MRMIEEDLRLFIKDITLFLQTNNHPKSEPMFQRAYRLYVKYDVEREGSYTEEEHAANLLITLEDKRTCYVCPARHSTQDKSLLDGSCRMCVSFISPGFDRFYGCPCSNLGKEEAIKLTWLKLEEKGYI